MSDPQHVYTSDGHRGVIVGETNPSRDDPRFLEVQMEDGTRLHVPAELLELRADGAFDLKVGYAEIEGRQATGSERARATAGDTLRDEEVHVERQRPDHGEGEVSL